MWSDWLVVCDYGFSLSALWCPLATPTVLLGFLLPWTWGISSQLLQQSAAATPYLEHGVVPLSRTCVPLHPIYWNLHKTPMGFGDLPGWWMHPCAGCVEHCKLLGERCSWARDPSGPWPLHLTVCILYKLVNTSKGFPWVLWAIIANYWTWGGDGENHQFVAKSERSGITWGLTTCDWCLKWGGNLLGLSL